MRILSLTPREIFFAAISWKGLLLICFAVQAIMHLPGRIAGYVPELQALIAEHHPLLNTISLVTLAAAVLQLMLFMRKRAPRSVEETFDFHAIEELLNDLSHDEKRVLRWYFERDNKSTPQYLLYDAPGVKRLADADIIFQFSATRSPEGFPFLMKIWIWDYLKRRPELISEP